MHSEKIKQLEKALQNPAATPEMKAKFQDAIDKLKAEEKKEPEYKQPEVFKPTKKETEAAMNEVAKHLSKDKVLKSTDHKDLKIRGKKEKPEKQAPAVKKAIAEKAQTDNAAEMQALIDNATKSSEEWSHNKVLAEAQKFEALRSKSAQTLDAKGDSKKRLTPTRENLIRWMNNPGGFDLIGIDTYKAGDATADLKIKKEVFWNRFNIHYKH